MKGHTRRRGNRWVAIYDLPRDPVTGRRRQRWESGFRTKRDADAALSWVCGKPPLGYRQVEGEIVHDEREVEMVRTMASLYLASHDTKAVAHEVTERGYRTRIGNAWDADGVRRVLRNTALRGTFRWEFPGATILGEEFAAEMFTYEAEPVLDAETFDQVARFALPL